MVGAQGQHLKEFPKVTFKRRGWWDFLGSTVVKTLSFQCRGRVFNRWLGD